MNPKDWQEHVIRELEIVEKLIDRKQEEYVKDEEDMLINFKKGGIFQGITPEQSLLGGLSKHCISVADMIKKVDNNYSYSLWQEKCHDIIVYQLLLLALIKEREETIGGDIFRKETNDI